MDNGQWVLIMVYMVIYNPIWCFLINVDTPKWLIYEGKSNLNGVSMGSIASVA